MDTPAAIDTSISFKNLSELLCSSVLFTKKAITTQATNVITDITRLRIENVFLSCVPNLTFSLTTVSAA